MSKKLTKAAPSKAAPKKAPAKPKADQNLVVGKGREIALAAAGAAALVRKQGEKLFGNFVGESKQLQKQAGKLAANLVSDVQEQANGVIAQVKSATSANLGWVGEKAQDQVGKVLNRLGVPSKSDVNQLARRVDELHKQVKLLKKAA